MVLREDATIPPASDFARFLASSITFMNYLSEVSVYMDDKRLVHLTKSSGADERLVIPRGLQTSSRKSIMHIKSIKSTRKFVYISPCNVAHGTCSSTY